jgi:hypothetical protein
MVVVVVVVVAAAVPQAWLGLETSKDKSNQGWSMTGPKRRNTDVKSLALYGQVKAVGSGQQLKAAGIMTD